MKRILSLASFMLAVGLALANPTPAQSECGQVLQSSLPGQQVYGRDIAWSGNDIIVGQALAVEAQRSVNGAFQFNARFQQMQGQDSALGSAVAIGKINGQFVVAGDSFADHINGTTEVNTGVVYVLDQDLNLLHTLWASDHAPNRQVGAIVDTEGDVVVASCLFGSRAYVWVRDQFGVFNESILLPNDPQNEVNFSWNVATTIDSTGQPWAFVSDHRHAHPQSGGILVNSGQVYVYRLDPILGWVLSGVIEASDRTAEATFGRELTAEEDRLFVAGGGYVYAFELQGGVWVETQKFTGDPNYGVGELAVSGNQLICEAGGAVQRFRHDGSQWDFEQVYQGTVQTLYGNNVAMSNGRYAIGEQWYNQGEGAIFVEPGPNIGTSYCGPAENNSTGQPAVLKIHGSEVVALNNTGCCVTQLPVGSLGYFVVSQTQGFIAHPGGSQGNLCLSGSIGRGNQAVYTANGSGMIFAGTNLQQMPQPNGFVMVQSGQTWNFQFWYRDGSSSNFSDAVSVTYQ